MTRLAGDAELNDAAQANVKVVVVDANDSDPSNWTVAGGTTTDANGAWEVTGLVGDATERYLAVVQYDDGTKYNAFSKPFLSTPPAPGMRVYITGTATPDSIFGYDVSTAFDVTTASNTSSLDVDSQDTFASGLTWNDIGTKLYLVGTDGESIHEYAVSTPFDITTASPSSDFSVSSEDSSPAGMAWNSDGSKMYVAGNSNNNLYEYNVSTAFDVTTASHSTTVDVSSEDGTPSGLAWNDDGSKLYLVGNSNADIFEYNVSTQFDISTASQSSTLNVGNETSNPRGVTWNLDGSKLYVIGSATIFEYDVSTQFDITTASQSASLDVSSEDGGPSGMAWAGTPQY